MSVLIRAGRILELLMRGHLAPKHIKLFVLDEADSLLAGTFTSQVTSVAILIFRHPSSLNSRIHGFLPKVKQTIACSATYPPV